MGQEFANDSDSEESEGALMMEKRTTGTIIAVKNLWWIKVNRKLVRTTSLDGASFPHLIKVKYTVDGKDYIKRSIISIYAACPVEGETVPVIYQEGDPRKSKIDL